MKISVVIPTYNRSELLYRVLCCLWRQQAADYEVLISNDDDPDEAHKTTAVCKEFIDKGMPITEFITYPYKRGKQKTDGSWETGVGWSNDSYPTNVGIKHATGDVVLINSSEVMSLTNTIEQHRQGHLTHTDTFLVSTTHGLSSATQNNIDNLDWKNNPMSLLFPGSCFAMLTGNGKCYDGMYDMADAPNPHYFLMSVPKKALWDIRGLDEDYYGRMSCGDCDLADRLIRSNIKPCYDPNVLAAHQAHGDPDTLGKNRITQVNEKFGDGIALYEQRKHMGVVRNLTHEWGQYPRDMTKLPSVSGSN